MQHVQPACQLIAVLPWASWPHIELPWGFLLVLCFLVGAVGTAVWLRNRAAGQARRRREVVRAGEAVWACHVRELLPRRALGLAGDLYLGTDDVLRLVPEAVSVKRRGVGPEQWRMDGVGLSMGRRRLDITGVSYRVLTLRPEDGRPERRFACTLPSGRLPGS